MHVWLHTVMEMRQEVGVRMGLMAHMLPHDLRLMRHMLQDDTLL
jgi:hypothetical protein